MAAALCYGVRGGGAQRASHLQPGNYDIDSLIEVLAELRRFLGGEKATLLWMFGHAAIAGSAHGSDMLRASVTAETIGALEQLSELVSRRDEELGQRLGCVVCTLREAEGSTLGDVLGVAVD